MRSVILVSAIASAFAFVVGCGDDAGSGRAGGEALAVDAADVGEGADGGANGGDDAMTDDVVATTDASLDGADAAAEPDGLGLPGAGNPLLVPGFLNIAHRGGGRLAPEATMAAYQNALRVGADVIEIDVHSTADGVIVCLHDSTVDRTTDGSGPVQRLTFEELRALDAGYRFTRDGGDTFPFRGMEVQVPTMREILAAFPGVPIAIEIKQTSPDITAQVVAMIQEFDAVDRVVVASLSDATIANVRALEPRMLTAYAVGEMAAFAVLNAAGFAQYLPPSRMIQAPERGVITPERLTLARSLGVGVHLWTLNDRESMLAAIALGVDGIFTDDPALLAAVIDEVGR